MKYIYKRTLRASLLLGTIVVFIALLSPFPPSF